MLKPIKAILASLLFIYFVTLTFWLKDAFESLKYSRNALILLKLKRERCIWEFRVYPDTWLLSCYKVYHNL